jgi:hypothetical protein
MLLLAMPAQADIPLSSLRPQPRPQVELPPLVILPPASFTVAAPTARPKPRPQIKLPPVAILPPVSFTAAVPTLRPKPRPAYLAPAVVAAQPKATAQPDASIRRISSVRPQPRPAGLATKAARAVEPVAQITPAPAPKSKPETKAEKRKKASRKGSVCGDASIKGEEIARITSKVSGCGISDPVRITSVSGVRLSQPATLDCNTAKALNRWVETGLQPAYGRSKVVELRVAAHYICRSRNNAKGAKISEHGRGKAIDIAGVVLENGKTASVQGGFGKELRRAHKSACGIFGTTLGPGSDGFHEDHMHFDTANHRNGPYCR